MRWFPLVEVLNGSTWTIVPNEMLTGSVSVDMRHGQANTAAFTVRTIAIPGGVDSWIFKRVRIAFMYAPSTSTAFARKDLFDGFIQGLGEQPVVGITPVECTSITTRVFKRSAALLAQLESEVPWSDYVFGVRGELNAEEQFEKLLNASNYVLDETGLVPIDSIRFFSGGRPGTALQDPADYDMYHTAGDVIAGGPGSFAGAISLSRSDPKVSATADDPRYELLPEDVFAKAPVNEVVCIVRHRFKRLCQEVFNYNYEGGNIAVDWKEKNARFLTMDALSSAISGMADFRPVGVNTAENPPPNGTNIGPVGSPSPFLINDSDRPNLLQKFNYNLGRRYVQDVEYVYQKTVRCEQSIARFGLQTETRELTIESDDDWAEWTDWKIQPKLAQTGYLEIRTALQMTSKGKEAKGTKAEAELAIGALVAEAKRAIKVGHTPALSGAIGSNAAITTSYSVPMNAKNLTMATGQTCALDTPYTTVDGLVMSLRYAMDSSGAATCAIELVTSVPEGIEGEVPPVTVPAIKALESSKGYRGNTIIQLGV